MRTLIILQLFIVALLVVYISYVSFFPRTHVSIAPIQKVTTVEYATGDLEYFFEFTPGVRDDQVKPGWLDDYELINTINSDTLNERYEYATTTPPETYRIITLGDSWTYGQFVSTSDNFSEKLENLLNERLLCSAIRNFEVINLGMPNYDIAYAAERFKIRGRKYNPDIVLWFLIPNDFTEITDVFRKLYNDVHAALKDLPDNQEYDEIQGFKGHRVSSGDVHEAMVAFTALEQMHTLYTPTEILTYQFSAFDTFQNYFPGPTIFYYVPKYLGYFPEIISRLSSYADTNSNIELVASEFQWEKDFSLPDQHPSPKGHARIASEYFDYLLKHHLTDCVVRD
ncbi:MAG: SGNH/GDSL hydrolase family protein [Patescibacteria group bacterium UBA2163]